MPVVTSVSALMAITPWLVAALLLLTPARSTAAVSPGVLGDYRITSWTDLNGLPRGAVWALAQDPNGFLWLGTDAGLIRFDGVRFQRWDALGREPLPDGPVHALWAARDGSLWVGFGTERGEVARIRGANVTMYGPSHGLRAGEVRALIEDREGIVWAGGRAGLFRLAGNQWEREPDAVLGVGPVTSASINGAGTLIFGTPRAVFTRAGGAHHFSQVPVTDGRTRSLALDPSGIIWWLDSFAGFRRAGDATASPLPAQRGKGWTLLLDSRGHLWVGTFGQGLWRARLGAERQVLSLDSATNLNGLSNNVIYSVLEDREGNVWAGTPDGLNRLTPHRVTHFATPQLVTGLETTANGLVLAITEGGVVEFAAGDHAWRQASRDLSGLRPQATHVDREGALWIATADNVLRVRVAEGSAHIVERLDLRHVRSIASSPHGAVVLYDSERGLLRWHAGRLEPVPTPAALRGDRVVRTFIDRHDTIWVASRDASLAAIDRDGHARFYDAEAGFDPGRIREVFEDAAGTLWIAGASGLSRFANGTFVTLHRTDELPIDSITSMVSDEAGRLWMGTALGVLCIEPREFDKAIAGHWRDVGYTLFGASDGVAGTVSWDGYRGAIRAADGSLWFLTERGVTVLNPSILQDASPAAAPIHIETVTFNDGQSLAATPMRELDADVDRLQIDYASPTLTERRTRFRYRLDGFDRDWVDAGPQRHAIYTNLPPRTYRFVVELQQHDGTWGPSGAAWDFSVKPAFYQTAWFMAASALGFVAIGWSAWRFRVRQVRHHFAAVLGERARLSREIHDTLLQSLAGVALQCDALANDPAMSAHGTPKDGLLRLRRQVEEYIRECRQSIWDLRSPTLEMSDLPTALRNATERTATARKIATQMVVDGRVRRCPQRIEEQLLRIGQEAVMNAVRHAGAQTVNVHLTYGQASILLRISDDGRGFDPEDPANQMPDHCGLTAMRERADAIGGVLRLESRPGQGTDISVVVPLAHNSETSDDE